MKLLYRLKFRTQIIGSFAIIICFVTAATFLLLHTLLRESYRAQESAVLETHGRQISINIENRMAYFMSYLQLLARDSSLLLAMENDSFDQVAVQLAETVDEFMKLNGGRVSTIRIYRKNVYTHIDGLGNTQDIFRFFEQENAPLQNTLATGTYLNNRNEKVFSIFKKIYQTNPGREYYLEICVYETELYGFFNKDHGGNTIYLFYEDALISTNDRQNFSKRLYQQSEMGGGVITRAQMAIPAHAIVISEKSASGLEVLIETNAQYLEQGYFTLLVRMLPVLFTMLLMAFVVAGVLTTQVNRRLGTLQEKIVDISNWNLAQKVHIDGADEFSILAQELEETRMRILGLVEQNNKTHELMRIAEMSALRSQINSHFLFNSLSSIKWLARADSPEKLAEAVDSLALFLRYSLAIHENQILLSNEIKQLEAYTHLQSLRYGDEVNVQIDIDTELMDCKTVRLILQPLVENAIYHGRRASGAKLNITIYSYWDEQYYYLVVEDDGNGIAPEMLRSIQNGKNSNAGSGYGLRNVVDRVQMCLGDNSSEVIQIKSRPNTYTTITIRQPL